MSGTPGAFLLDPRFTVAGDTGVGVVQANDAAGAVSLPLDGHAAAAPAAAAAGGGGAPAAAGAGGGKKGNAGGGKKGNKKGGKKGNKKTAEEAEAAKAARRAASEAAAKRNKSKAKAKAPAAVVEVPETPEGEKKDMSSPMLPEYHPRVVEAAWDSWWTKSGFCTTDPEAARAAGEDGRFVMVIPPPNVTGSLHLGHALTCSIEDTLVRWHRMNGRPTMWLPGTDHAGIATQAVVEKRLFKERGITRHDMTRDDFLKEVWSWKEMYGGRICSQLRSLGVSVDWSRERFTMDEGLSRGVVEAFCRMHERGLIYRDTRLVNWCCTLNSAISDIEVDYMDFEKPTRIHVPGHGKDKLYEFGTIISFAYKVEDSEEEVVVATTRLETMLGDTGVAVHPEDPRYTHLHGKFVVHPFNGRRIPIITDAELVDMEFGTGAVKITPAHDPNDFACGRRHGLEEITIFNDDGTINEAGAPFTGLRRFDARVAMVERLQEMGLYRGKAPNAMRIGFCSRSGDVIEPMLKPQWWVDCKDMAARAVKAVRDGDLKIEPAFHEVTWYRWLENIRDWCISRQLWWGHRIPAYFAVIEGQARAPDSSREHWVVARTPEEARRIAAERFSVPEAQISLEQDEDVLDTWFSSGLFPFSTFGWPDESNPDLDAFYPNSILETGHDILFFWVARMVMMGLELTGKLPFKTIYLHAMVRDKYGRKMSKSLGNVIDPMEVIEGCTLERLHEKLLTGNLPPKEVEKAKAGQTREFPDGIPECGADALRFGLMAFTIQGRDINLDISRVVAYRHFCNKLWNAVKFALMHLSPEHYTHDTPINDMVALLAGKTGLALRDRWVLDRLNEACRAVDENMRAYNFSGACMAAHHFWLHELCDVYLELTKPVFRGTDEASKRLARFTLYTCLDRGLRLLHPFMPFVTEELWQRLPGRGTAWDATTADPESIMVAPFPQVVPGLSDPEALAGMELAMATIRSVRSLRSTLTVKPSAKLAMFIATDDAATQERLRAQEDDFQTLAGAEAVTYQASGAAAPGGCAAAVVDDSLSVMVQVRGHVDFAAEITKIEKRMTKAMTRLTGLRARMAKPGFAKSPAEIQQAAADDAAKAETEVAMMRETIKTMQAAAADDTA